MRMVLKDVYRSLSPFESEELNDLTIITGRNGSGKTQLLDLINLRYNSGPTAQTTRVEFLPTISSVQVGGIIKNTTEQININQWQSIVRQHFNTFKNLPQSSIEVIKYISENNLASQIDLKKNTFNFTDPEYLLLINKEFAETHRRAMVDTVNFAHERDVLQRLLKPRTIALLRLVDELSRATNKKYSELTEADFLSTPILELHIDEDDLFKSKVELIFFNYLKRREENKRLYFEKMTYGDENESVADTEFIKQFIPPWDLINSILNTHNIDFQIKGPRGRFIPDATLDLKLIKTSTQDLIEFGDLSSGEQVIIGLILKLFTSEYYRGQLTFAELLILDEPDAHLHPEMSKLLLDVLAETFVGKYKMKVIMTTHSPSTVAIAPEGSIYQLTNGKTTSLKNISKDEALNILTSFIPTLSIDYQNHRQVFVESPSDVFYYQNIFDVHQLINKPDHKLYFISNSYGKSNCAEVVSVVKALRTSGNKTCFGVVDWDKSNKPDEFIEVHGYNNRYSIENYLLDPFYLLALLIEMKAHSTTQTIGVSDLFNQYSFGDQTNAWLQEKAKVFFNLFEKKYNAYKYDSPKVSIAYYNGKSLEMPIWYLHENGHDLSNKVRELFPALKSKFPNDTDMLKALTTVAVKSYPFVSVDSILTIEKLSKRGLTLLQL